MTTTRSARTAVNQHILTLSCPERPGIVHAVTSFLVGEGCDITEHQQFDDTDNGVHDAGAGRAVEGEDVLVAVGACAACGGHGRCLLSIRRR